MRFLLDTVDLQSPLRGKHSRVLTHLLAEIEFLSESSARDSFGFDGLAVEIAMNPPRLLKGRQRSLVHHQCVPEDALHKKAPADNIWDAIPTSTGLDFNDWLRVIKVAFFTYLPFARRLCPPALKQGLAWNFAYAVEAFSPSFRRRVVALLDLNTDVSRLAMVYDWLSERGYNPNLLTIAPSPPDEPNRLISPGPDDVLLLTGLSWRYDVETLSAVKKAYRCRLVCFVYDLLPIDFPPVVTAAQRQIYKAFLRALAQVADLIVTPNGMTASRLADFFAAENLSPPPIYPIDISPVCLAPKLNQAEPAVPARLQAFGLPRKRILLCVSDMRERSNILWLYTLCAQLNDIKSTVSTVSESFITHLTTGAAHADWILVLAGRIIDSNILRILLEDPNWTKVGVFLESPRDDELSWLYSHATLCLEPAFQDSTGLTVIEALNHGVCCIAADTPTLVEASKGRAIHLKRDAVLWKQAIQAVLNGPTPQARTLPHRNVLSWPSSLEAVQASPSLDSSAAQDLVPQLILTDLNALLRASSKTQIHS